jgi:hypothetical protein
MVERQELIDPVVVQVKRAHGRGAVLVRSRSETGARAAALIHGRARDHEYAGARIGRAAIGQHVDFMPDSSNTSCEKTGGNVQNSDPLWSEYPDDGRVSGVVEKALAEIGVQHLFTTRLFFPGHEPEGPGIRLVVGPADCIEKWRVWLSGCDEVCFCFPPSVPTDRPWRETPEPQRSHREMVAEFLEVFRSMLQVTT